MSCACLHVSRFTFHAHEAHASMFLLWLLPLGFLALFGADILFR